MRAAWSVSCTSKQFGPRRSRAHQRSSNDGCRDYRKVSDLRAEQRGIRAARPQGPRDHQGDGHHPGAAGAGARAPLDTQELTDRDLAAVVRLVYEKSGITLHEGKRALIVARLQKRVREGQFGSFTAYLRHVEADRSGDELTLLLDAIATNH